MSTINITKDNTGKLIGFTERDQVALNRWRAVINNLEPGELTSFEHKFSVNRKFHNLCMRMWRDVFEDQEKFDDFDQLRYWIFLGSGHCSWHAGPRGAVVPIPGSFSDKACDGDDEKKRVIFEKTRTWLLSGEPGERLWKHLSEPQRVEKMQLILLPYEEEEVYA